MGLTAQIIELGWYGLGTQEWGVWAAGLFISISSITYAAISAYLSLDTPKDKQGAVQGTLMGARWDLEQAQGTPGLTSTLQGALQRDRAGGIRPPLLSLRDQCGGK